MTDHDTYALLYQFFIPNADPIADILNAHEALWEASSGEILRAMPTPSEWRKDGCKGNDHLLSDAIFGTTTTDRALTFGHIEVPCGFVHPDLGYTIAELLNDDLSEVLRTHPRRLKSALRKLPADRLEHDGFSPTDLILTRVPVIPPTDRPLRTFQAFDDDRWFIAQLTQGQPSQADQAYATLLSAVPYHADAPWFQDDAVAQLNEAVETLCRVISRPSTSKPHAHDWHPQPQQQEIALTVTAPTSNTEPLEPSTQACALLDKERALIQHGSTLQLIHWPTQRLIAETKTEHQLQSTAQNWAILTVPNCVPTRTSEGTLCNVALLDTTNALHWYEGPWPSDLHAIFTATSHTPTSLVLQDLACARQTSDLTHRWSLPEHSFVHAHSPDGRFIAIADRVFDLETGLPLFYLESAIPDLNSVQQHYNDPEGEHPTIHQLTRHHVVSGGPTALVRSLGSEQPWRWLTSTGWVCEDGQCLYGLQVKATAAAFSPDGAQLAILTDTTLFVLNVAPFEILAQLKLDALPQAPIVAASTVEVPKPSKAPEPPKAALTKVRRAPKPPGTPKPSKKPAKSTKKKAKRASTKKAKRSSTHTKKQPIETLLSPPPSDVPPPTKPRRRPLPRRKTPKPSDPNQLDFLDYMAGRLGYTPPDNEKPPSDETSE